MLCYLIGVNHSYQFRGYRDGGWRLFDAYLAAFCQSTETQLIAEELNKESVEKWACQGAKGSVAQDVASRMGVEHRFCDPSSIERVQLGIPSEAELKRVLGIRLATTKEQDLVLSAEERAYWPLREKFWLGQIQKANLQRTTFIAGSNHVDSFSALLTANGIEVRVEQRKWVPGTA